MKQPIIQKMQDLNDFYTVALFSAIRTDIYVKINSLSLITKQFKRCKSGLYYSFSTF